jgi:hypothetical protein
MKRWMIALTGPVVWLASLGASFAAAPPACWAQSKLPLFAIPGAAIVLTVAAGLLSWRDSSGVEGKTEAARTLVSGGMYLNAFFAIVILAQFVAPSILGVCQ